MKNMLFMMCGVGLGIMSTKYSKDIKKFLNKSVK